MTGAAREGLRLVEQPHVTPGWQAYDLTADEQREAADTYRAVEWRCRSAADDPTALEAAPWFAARADWHARQAMTIALRSRASEAGHE